MTGSQPWTLPLPAGGKRPRRLAAHVGGMNTYNENDVNRDIKGRFDTKRHRASEVTLSGPSESMYEDLAMQRMEELGYTGFMDEDAAAQTAQAVAGSLNFSDENIAAAADEVLMGKYGVAAQELRSIRVGIAELRRYGNERAAAAVERLMTSSYGRPAAETAPMPSGVALDDDPRVQAGEVFDELRCSDGTVYHRRRPGVTPYSPDVIRIQASRPLTPEDVQKFAGLVGYSFRVHASNGKSSLPDPVQDSPYSFTVFANTGRNGRRNLDEGLQKFEDDLQWLIEEGSPVRPTKENTRLIEGFNEPGLGFEIYYDSVSKAN